MTVVSIVVSWNVKEHLSDVLQDLGRQTGNFHHSIIVVDNSSSDGSGGAVRRRFPNAQLIENERNIGFAAAVNMAIRRAGGADYYAIVNPDARCDRDTLSKMIEFAVQNRSLGIVGCHVIDDAGRIVTKTRYPRVLKGILLDIKWHFLGRSRRRVNRRVNRPIECVDGSFFLIQKAVVERIGLFDERFWAYFEESDYCLRAKKAGFAVDLCQDVSIRHAGRKSFGQDRQLFRRIWNQSQYRFLSKHHPVQAVIFKFAMKSLWSLEAAVRYGLALPMGHKKALDETTHYGELRRSLVDQ